MQPIFFTAVLLVIGWLVFALLLNYKPTETCKLKQPPKEWFYRGRLLPSPEDLRWEMWGFFEGGGYTISYGADCLHTDNSLKVYLNGEELLFDNSYVYAHLVHYVQRARANILTYKDEREAKLCWIKQSLGD